MVPHSPACRISSRQPCPCPEQSTPTFVRSSSPIKPTLWGWPRRDGEGVVHLVSVGIQRCGTSSFSGHSRRWGRTIYTCHVRKCLFVCRTGIIQVRANHLQTLLHTPCVFMHMHTLLRVKPRFRPPFLPPSPTHSRTQTSEHSTMRWSSVALSSSTHGGISHSLPHDCTHHPACSVIM